MKRLGIDIDGVLADFSGEYLRLANKIFGHPENPALNPVWDFNIPPGQAATLWEVIKSTNNFWCTLKPISQIRLPQENHTLIFITSRIVTAGETPEAQSAYWLANILGVTYPTVLVVPHWHDKERLVKYLNLDAFIDDKAETVQQMRQHGHNCYVFDQPWNQVSALSDKRVFSMEQFFEDIEK